MTREQNRAIVFGLVALFLCAVMNGYHYSLEGARGLYLWNRTSLFRFIILMGLIPISVALISIPLDRLANKLASRITRGLAIVLSIMVSLASVGFLGLLVVGPRLGTVEPARLTLIDPSKGIVPQGVPTSASFSPGGGPGISKAPSTSSGSKGASGTSDPIMLRLSFSSDPHWGVDTSNPQVRTDILKSVEEHKPDAFFMLGDTVETGSSSVQWNFALSDLEAIIPDISLRPVMGNHDALFGGQYLYRKAFFPKGFSSDSGSPYYYSIDAKYATIVVLDLPWGTENYFGKQRKWLEKTLAAADKSKPIIALSHSFFYASGYDDPVLNKPWYDHYQNIPAISPLFEKYGVKLVISGHNHYMEYLRHNGVSYAVIGAMGGLSDPKPTHISPASVWMAVGAFGRLDVDVTAKELILSYRDQNGALMHEERIPY
jgi:UDP-2,3-diacylglucosamine pyrophosphatase LpxH